MKIARFLTKIFKYKVKDKRLAVISVFVLLALLLPLCWCALYAAPFYDDYNFIRFTRGYSIQYDHGYLWGAYRTMRQEWWAWQGTYSAVYLFALNPLLFGEEFYKYGIIGILVFFTLAVMVFTVTISVRVLCATKAQAFVLSSVVCATLLELIYTAQEGIYWYIGAIHYTFMPGCMLLMLAAAVEIFYRKHISARVMFMLLTTILAIICAGSNFVTTLQGLILLLTVGGLGILFRRKDSLFLTVPLAAYIFGFIKNITAPGNSVRSSGYEGCGPIESVLKSFVAAGKHFWEFTGPPAILFLLFALPVIWCIVKRMKYNFRMPLLVTLYSVCLYATGFTSSLYAMGSEGVPRTWVAVKYTLLLLLFVNLVYWLGWLSKRKIRLQIMDGLGKQPLAYYVIMSLFTVGVLLGARDRIRVYSSYGAFYTLRTGEAQSFHQEYLDRVEVIKNSGETVEVEPLQHKPFMLCIDDLSENSGEDRNIGIASWYYKDEIYVRSIEFK